MTALRLESLPFPPQIIPKSIAGPGLPAHILTGKFIDHTPFYRQEKQFVRLGVEVSRTSMCNSDNYP